MTKKTLFAIATIAVSLAGCSSDKPSAHSTDPGEHTTGTVEFNLDLDNGESTDQINLHLECPGISQDHVIDVEDGIAKAAFGGLAGMCSVVLTAETDEGTSCRGTQSFTVVDDVVLPVVVTLTCQGYNMTGDGTVVISPEFEFQTCGTDLIRKIYANPSSLLLGDSTDVQVELHPGAAVGTPHYTFHALTNATHTGAASLAALSSCAMGAQACQEVTCNGLGAVSAVDPVTGLPSAGVFVQVVVEDDTCRDAETVLIECLQDSTCGDGTVSGVEDCEDGNMASGDGCSASCEDEFCGDGVINDTDEQCDGTVGVGLHQACNVTTCDLINLPYCGDGVVNGTDVCDGSAGLLTGQICSATCTITPVCGNNHLESPEQCDDGNLIAGDGCSPTCTTLAPPTPVCGDGVVNQASEQCDGSVPAGQPAGTTCSAACLLVAPPTVNACLQCVTTGEIATNVTNDFCSSSSDALCYAVLACYIGPGNGANGCFANGATPAECYCGAGADTDACATASFVPFGDCVTSMRAAMNAVVGGTATNSQIVDGVFGTDHLGWAGQVMLEAQGNATCNPLCGF